MIDVALSVLALVAGGLTLQAYAAASGSLGYQDERGFHPGAEVYEPLEDRPSESPN
jgi:hypothetical protein